MGTEAMRQLPYGVGVVLLTLSLTFANTDVSMLEDDAVACTQAQVDAAERKDAAAKGALKAATPPAANHAPLVKAAEEAAKKLKQLRANPVCQKLMAAKSAAAKVKNAEKKAKVDAKAAKEAGQKRQLKAAESRKKAEAKKEQAEKKGAQNEQLETLKRSGVEGLQKIRVKQKNAKDRKYMKIAHEEIKLRHIKAVKDMKIEYKEMRAELAEKTAAKLAKVKANAAAAAVKLMANAKEEGQKAVLNPAAMRETRAKNEKNKELRKKAVAEKGSKQDARLVERKNDIKKVNKDIVAAKDAKAEKYAARLKHQKKPTAKDIKNAKKVAVAVAAKASTKTGTVDTGKLKPASSSPADKAAAKAQQRVKQVAKPVENSPEVRGLEKTKSPSAVNGEKKKAAAKKAQQKKQNKNETAGAKKQDDANTKKKVGKKKKVAPTGAKPK